MSIPESNSLKPHTRTHTHSLYAAHTHTHTTQTLSHTLCSTHTMLLLVRIQAKQVDMTIALISLSTCKKNEKHETNLERNHYMGTL